MYKGQLYNLSLDEDGTTYSLSFLFYEESPANPQEGKEMKVDLYSMTLTYDQKGFAMIPEGELMQCLTRFSQHSGPEGLTSEEARQWYAGYLADKLAGQVDSADLTSTWSLDSH